jgi:hypothetical protein
MSWNPFRRYWSQSLDSPATTDSDPRQSFQDWIRAHPKRYRSVDFHHYPSDPGRVECSIYDNIEDGRRVSVSHTGDSPQDAFDKALAKLTEVGK